MTNNVRMSGRRAATSSDVAARAGTSRATVSAVFSGTRGIRVSQETRERVLAVAAELNYSPNPLARALRRQQSGIIGFIRHTENPLTMTVVDEFVTRTAMNHGWHVLEASINQARAHDSEEVAQFMLSRRVDAVIFDRPRSIDEIQRFAERDLPIVQILRPQPDIATSTVVVDPGPGIEAAVDHLAQQGHHRLGFIGCTDPHPANAARLEHFRAAVSRHQIPLSDEYVQLGETYALAEGYVGTHNLLALPSPPTAIFATAETLALGVLQALHQAHVHVPEEMSVIAYDDVYAPYACPPLTSVAQPFQEVAEHAIELILRALDRTLDELDEPTQIVLPTRLVVRTSTHPPLHLP